MLTADGENSQCLTQLSWPFKLNCNLLSTVDQTLINLSSPHDPSSSPSHAKLNPRILALCALIRVVYLDDCSKSTSQNFND